MKGDYSVKAREGFVNHPSTEIEMKNCIMHYEEQTFIETGVFSTYDVSSLKNDEKKVFVIVLDRLKIRTYYMANSIYDFLGQNYGIKLMTDLRLLA